MCIRAVIKRKVQWDELIKCVSLIHGNLLSFTDENMYIQNMCCSLLEEWWLRNHPERKTVAVNIPFYLLSRISSAVGQARDLKRLNQVKETLELIESDCPTFKCISYLIFLASTNPLTLKSIDGIEFLSYALANSPCLMRATHTVLKSVIPDNKHLVEIGEVYYRAVELADARGLLEKYSSAVLQDLAKSALYCRRTGPSKAAQDVLKVLSVLHRHKKKPQIENTLFAVYNPLLWGVFDLPNGEIRANAASLLLDIFPLIQSPCFMVQLDEALHTQCTKIEGSSEELLEIVECLHAVVASKSRVQLRTLLLKDLLPSCVEGFQVLPLSSPLLELLYRTLSLLSEGEACSHRLSFSKFLYKAGSLLGMKPNYDINLMELFEKVLRSVQNDQAVNRKSLNDLESLLLEMTVTAQRQDLTATKQQPWSHLPRLLVELIGGNECMIVRSLVEACCTGSASFRERFLPFLESAVAGRQDARDFLSTN